MQDIRSNVRSLAFPAVLLFATRLAAAAEAPTAPHVPVLQSAPLVPAGAITLGDAVARALEQNPTYDTARAESRRVDAVVREVEASWLPTLFGNGVYTHLDHPRAEAGTVILPQNGLNANLMLTVPLVMPRQWANTSEARNNARTQRASAEETRREVALATGRAYLAVYAQKLVIEVDERARDTARKHYDYAHRRYHGGVGTSLDEVRAAQEVAADEALVQQAYAQLSSAEEALGVVVGVDGPLDTTDEPELAPTPTLSRSLEEAARRADVVASDLRRRAAERVTRHDYTDYLPYLVGNAEPFYQDPATPTLPRTGYQMQLILTIPLYDGGLRYGQAREREALRVEARVAFDAELRQARSDVRTAFDTLRRTDDALAAARDAARLATQALDLANLAYTAGATSDLEVIDAERAARDAATQAEISADTARQARLNLLSVTNHFP